MVNKPKRSNAGKREPEPELVLGGGTVDDKKPKVEKAKEIKVRIDAKIVQAVADEIEAMDARKGRPGRPPKDPNSEPKPAGGKRKRGGDEEVMEVDKIVGMRAKKGGVQYKILWSDGSQTWEPYDNVMDDDLVDDFEEMKQIEVYGGQTLSPGSEVEVKNVMEGFENSWSAAVITKKEKANKYTVEYKGFVNDDGEADEEAGLDRKRLRLVPEAADKGWTPVVGEIVEVNEDDCWWEAFVESEGAKNKIECKFRVSDEVKSVTLGKKVRPCSWLTLEK